MSAVSGRTLLLLRHAKSAWDDLDMDDHERPLNKRGARDAPEMGAFIKDNGYVPSKILVSDAVRARATCALVLPELGDPAPHVEFRPSLYMAPPTTLLDLTRRIAEQHTTAMIIAHNPGMHAFALALIAQGARRTIGSMAVKFPTAALAIVRFEAASWLDVAPATGELVSFQVPRDLKAAS